MLLLLVSGAGLLLLWAAPGAVWAAMPAWLAVATVLYRNARSDDWLALPIAGLPFWWATGLAQYTTPVLAGIGVLGAVLAPPFARRFREHWDALGAEKWFAVAAFASMLPSFFAVTGGGRMFTYVRTIGLTGVSLAALLVVAAYARRNDTRKLVWLIVAFAGALGAWTLAQLVYKGSIHLPLQRTASLMELLPGRAGRLAARAVGEAAGIKYENVGNGRLVVRPQVFFIHAVTTGAIACLLGPLLWRRIAYRPITRAVAAAGFSGLIAAALVASLARGAYIGIAGALPAAVVVFLPMLRRVEWKKAAPAIGIGLAVAGIVLLTRGGEAKARQTSPLAEGSFVSRAAYYRATIKAMADHPVFGHGTQRDNFAAPLQVPKGTPVTAIPPQTTEVVFGEGDEILVFRQFPDGREERIRFRRSNGTRIDAATSDTQSRPPPGATVHTVVAPAEEAIVSNAKSGLISVQKLAGGRQERFYYGPSIPKGAPKDYTPPPDAPIVLRSKLISAADRDPPLGSHSTILGVGYKYGGVGLLAFLGLWIFTGLAPLRTLRTQSRPLLADARAIWIGVLAFGLQLPIYEYDYDSASPYLFYLLCGILLGLSAGARPVESTPADQRPARAGAAGHP